MAWMQADLDAADDAIRQALQGKIITFADRSWTSQDLSELRALRSEIARTVASARAFRVATVDKGVGA